MSRDTAPARSADQIAAELEAKRLRLAGTVGELESRLNPSSQVAKVKSYFMTQENQPRWDHIAIAAAAVVGAAVGMHLTSKTVRWLFAAPSNRVKITSPKVVYVPVSREALSLAAEQFAKAA